MVGWRAEERVFYLQCRYEQGSSWAPYATERATKQPSTLLSPQVPIRQTADPAGQNGEFNSLYAIHRAVMEVGRWWSDGVPNSVWFHVVNIVTNKRSSCAT